MKKMIFIMIAMFWAVNVSAQRVYGYDAPGLVGNQHYVDGFTIVEMVDWHQRTIAYAKLEGEWSLFPGIPLRQAIARAQREKAREEYERTMWDAAVYGSGYYPIVRTPRSTTSRRSSRTTTTDSSRFNAR